ncbi:type VI secretion system protein TssA [Rhizobium sp. SEMIA 4085]|uniref:Type VI secretion system-associated ImpA family protein n=1 Tax=Rhizobium gallicum bv. gallicum R602sp TaxID=1041138 RepID=A0A0B4XFU2_9HYPH|nr:MULTISPECIES: type VI secretion system protein TssA [Rhizobium]AJD45630.1 type VI secretion system-associated ImpA family protein [Rhizobium gallicum bv. gallicum R602sp]NNH30366.1 type VI secretion system protein TssA [Rhizobium sp. SEMIA 4085]TDW32887.1 type VI secretion system protein ImpA [Rhizobium azibense]
MNIRDIAIPFDENAPCGENIRNNTVSRKIYYNIKDARNLARTVERGISPGETIGVSPAWIDVNNLGLRILSSDSKDLEVLAWLAEAQLRLAGFAGLGEVYAAMMSLLDKHWDELHSIGDDDFHERFAPLAGLNGMGGEGTIIQAVRLSPLVPGAKFGQFSLWDFQLSQRPNESQRREDLYLAASEAGVSAMAAHLKQLNQCIASFDALTALLAERCGDQAPPSSNTRNVLFEAAAAIRQLAGIENDEAAADAETAPLAANSNSPEPEAPRPRSADTIASREEALEILAGVARYFRRTEPHSPISMALETLVRRSRMDFSELLAELLPEPQARNAVLSAAGIKSAADKGE